MSDFAWVTLATNDSYSLGALVLAHSLKENASQHPLVVLVTPGVTASMRTKLAAVFNLVEEVNVLDSQDEKNLQLLQRPELGVTFTKLHCWRLTQFKKCVFLDADILVLKNVDDLFEREELSAAPDVGWPDCFNSGVFVYRPSLDTYANLVQFAMNHGSFDGGDQGLLNLYFSDWAHKDISKHLPFIYNMCSVACYSYLPAYKRFGTDAKIVHFIGSTKPWLQYFNSETKLVQPSSDVQHLQPILQIWWDLFVKFVHTDLSVDMGGLAGAFAQFSVGAPRTQDQSQLEDSLRKQSWEVGSVDYLGRDSFDRIWSKISESISTRPPGVETPTAAAMQEASATETKPAAGEKAADAATPVVALDPSKTADVVEKPAAEKPPDAPAAAEQVSATPVDAPVAPAGAICAKPAEETQKPKDQLAQADLAPEQQAVKTETQPATETQVELAPKPEKVVTEEPIEITAKPEGEGEVPKPAVEQAKDSIVAPTELKPVEPPAEKIEAVAPVVQAESALKIEAKEAEIVQENAPAKEEQPKAESASPVVESTPVEPTAASTPVLPPADPVLPEGKPEEKTDEVKKDEVLAKEPQVPECEKVVALEPEKVEAQKPGESAATPQVEPAQPDKECKSPPTPEVTAPTPPTTPSTDLNAPVSPQSETQTAISESPKPDSVVTSEEGVKPATDAQPEAIVKQEELAKPAADVKLPEECAKPVTDVKPEEPSKPAAETPSTPEKVEPPSPAPRVEQVITEAAPQAVIPPAETPTPVEGESPVVTAATPVEAECKDGQETAAACVADPVPQPVAPPRKGSGGKKSKK